MTSSILTGIHNTQFVKISMAIQNACKDENACKEKMFRFERGENVDYSEKDDKYVATITALAKE